MVLLENIVFPIPLPSLPPVGTLGNVTMEKCVQSNTSLSEPGNSTSSVSAGVGQAQQTAPTLSSLLCSAPLLRNGPVPALPPAYGHQTAPTHLKPEPPCTPLPRAGHLTLSHLTHMKKSGLEETTLH